MPIDRDAYNNNNKYISKALNPSIINLHEAQSAVHVQLKPSKERNQRHYEKPWLLESYIFLQNLNILALDTRSVASLRTVFT